MKKLFCRLLFCFMILTGFQTMDAKASDTVPEELKNLYARSAVLMDGSSGRILFEKNGGEVMPMASTTKIMTCILALENMQDQETVTVSGNAAAQPKVHLGAAKGEVFYLKDILYSLMLESHNDSAVMVAEEIGGSVQQFAAMMNEKARQLGCENTHYVTPNGLDASDEGGAHSTTAADLALVLCYCIMQSPCREQFLEITRTRSYSFTNVDGTKSFTCNNHNLFLDMMEGALTGKTGFTSAAGYCYVGALKREERVYIVALLACGWPNNRNYKWSDAKALMNYGLENYRSVQIDRSLPTQMIPVENGIAGNGNPWEETAVEIRVTGTEAEQKTYLLGTEEKIHREISVKRKLEAPVREGEQLGKIQYFLGDTLLEEYMLTAGKTIEKKQFSHWLNWVVSRVKL